MDGLHISLIVVIIILLYIIYLFYFHYISGVRYECKFYPHIKFNTGDIILFKSLQSVHKIFTGSYFSHVGIVIMVNDEPYILELVSPNVKFFPLEERIKFYTEGVMCVKQINRPLDNERLAKIPEIIKWAKTVSYTEKSEDMYISNCAGSIWNYSDPGNDFDCAKFIAYILNKLDLIYKGDDLPCNLLNYFEHMKEVRGGYSYGDVYKMCFTDDSTIPDNVARNFRSIKNLGRKEFDNSF